MGQVNIRVPDEKVEQVRGRLKDLSASLGISQGELLDRGLDCIASTAPADAGLLHQAFEMLTRIEQMVEDLLELGAPVPNPTLPTESVPASEFRTPESIPGVQRGMPTRRESGSERVARERREKLDRTAALDSVDDPSIDRSDDFVSQS